MRPLHKAEPNLILDDLDRLLPLYKYIESSGATEPLPNIWQMGLISHSGRRSKLVATKASHAQRELDINLRHNLLQDALEAQLIAKHGSENVCREVVTVDGNSIDLVVRRPDGYWFYELKTYQSPRACIREAIGQLLEYSFW